MSTEVFETCRGFK